MAGEGVFGSMIASLGQGYNAEQDKQREQARQDLLTKLAIQKETDARNKADFDQALHARESGLIPQTEVQRQYDRANSSPLQQASDSIPLQMAGIGNAPGTDKPMVAGSTPAPTPTNLNDPRMSALQKAAGLLSSGDTITMPTSHGAQPMIYDYASSKNAREAEQEAKKQQAMSDRQDAKDAAAAERAAKAPVVLGPGQNRYDAQGNIIARGPAAKPTYKAVQKADGTWTSVDEATGLDPSGKPVVGIVPKDPNATGAGTWEITSFTKNGVIQEHNGKLGTYRDAPAGLEGKDQDNPQQLMQGGRGVQGARTMLVVSPKMKMFEDAAAKDPSKFTGIDQFMNQFAADFNAGKITNVLAAERAITQSRLNQTNPDLAMYLRNGLYYAFGENELQQRPSDFRTKMSDYLATMSPNMNPEQIGQVGEMRDELMRPSIETAERIRKRMKMAPDPLFDKYLGRGTAPGGPTSPDAGKIDPAHFAQLSPADQDYFRKQGRAP